MNLRSWAGPTALGVALASVAGGAVYLSRDGGTGVRAGSDGTPPKLRLASSYGDRAALGAPSSGGSQYQLEGTLSSDKPADGRVRRPRAGSADAAADLARALGLDGTPTAINDGWALRAPGNTILILNESGSWTWQPDCMADRPIQDEDANMGCGIAETPTTSAPPPGPSIEEAEAAATPVFSQLGFEGQPIRVSPGGASTTNATVTPAANWLTTLTVSRESKVVGGNGWLSGSTEGDAYPLISAAAAFEELKKQPRMAIDLCMVRKDGQPGCEEPAPTVIDGASLGLMLDYLQALKQGEPGGPVLVPAWIFSVKGSAETIPQIAVDPAYLDTTQDGPAPDATGKPDPAASSDPGSGSGGGTCAPDSCTSGSTPTEGAQPPMPSDPNGETTETLPIDAYTLEGDRIVHVQVTLGDCRAQWEPRLEAKQGSDAVYLILTASGPPPPKDGACTAIASEHDVTVTLDAPLGNRKVYDASSMDEVPRRT